MRNLLREFNHSSRLHTCGRCHREISAIYIGRCHFATLVARRKKNAKMQKIITIITKHHKITSIYTKRSNDPTYTCVQMCVCAMWSNNNNNKKKWTTTAMSMSSAVQREKIRRKKRTQTLTHLIFSHILTHIWRITIVEREPARAHPFCSVSFDGEFFRRTTTRSKRKKIFCFVLYVYVVETANVDDWLSSISLALGHSSHMCMYSESNSQ